jgi:hypothetical protein
MPLMRIWPENDRPEQEAMLKGAGADRRDSDGLNSVLNAQPIGQALRSLSSENAMARNWSLKRRISMSMIRRVTNQ